jgi:RNA polymerase-binding transcription factor DksA
MLDIFEKLINEHGSSAILRERLGLIKAQYEALESENMNLKTQCQTQQTEIQQIRMRLAETEAALQALNRGTFAKYVCDHCGSPNCHSLAS